MGNVPLVMGWLTGAANVNVRSRVHTGRPQRTRRRTGFEPEPPFGGASGIAADSRWTVLECKAQDVHNLSVGIVFIDRLANGERIQ